MKAIIAATALGLTALSALPAAAQVDQRHVAQQERIEQGVRSGQLTPTEAKRDERQQQRIENREHRMRARSGGVLTPQQRHHLNRMENKASRHIYRTKHNVRHS